MISSWSDAIGLSFAWSFGWGLVLTCYVLDWKIEWMQPKLWFLFLKKELNKTEDFFLNASAIPPKVLGAFKKVLSILETGDFQNLSASIGQSYRKKLEHELALLKKNEIKHEIRMTHLKLTEENEKKQDFRHWSDAGREWREIVLQGTVLNRYRSLKNGKILYEDFFPHGSVLLRQSRHIRHDEVGSKNRNEEQQFYAQYQNIICPSCGAEITLKGDEAHCPYCGGYIKSDFFDWQTEEFLVYRSLNPNASYYKLVLATILTFFFPSIPCFRFIHNDYLMFGTAFALTLLLAGAIWILLLNQEKKAHVSTDQIVRYDEKVLIVDLNEALYGTELTADALFYSVDKLQLKDVENTENRTTITISAVLHKLTLQPNQKILNKNEKITLKLYRARYPRRMKSKGQAVFEEKECPRCGANFMPDKNGCCSYCGYQLSIDNSKWRIDYE
ncbi:zinc ribbon domain-containing protein [Blautia stercoris]